MALVLDGSNDTITGLLINSANIVDGSIVNADINASAAIASTKLSGISSGKFSSYAIIADQKSSNTSGGSFSSGGDRTRDLNTEIADADGIVSISNNQFTLQAGTYLIRGNAVAYNVGRHIAWIYDVTNSANVGYFGTMKTAYSGATTSSHFYGRHTISGATVYEIRHKCETSQSKGFGIESGSSYVNLTNTYTVVQIFKES